MSKSIAKKFLALAISVLMIAMSTVYAFAVETENVLVQAEPDLQVLGDTITLKDNQVMYATYNLTENHQWGVNLSNNNEDGASITRLFRDCVDEPLVINTEKGASYDLYTISSSSKGGAQTVKFDTTGGEYVKVRAKLSAVSGYFNEDGSHTTSRHTFYFGDVEYDGKSEYTSVLAIKSGGVITGVAPDKNGFVEFYVCTDINVSTNFYTDYSWEIHKENDGITYGGGGGTNGGSIHGFRIGSVNGSYGVYIKDATSVQMYATKLMAFDNMQKFRADVDRDGKINIVDATKIQLYVAGYKY